MKRKFEVIKGKYFEGADSPRILYHYCTEETLKKILNSGKLWATDILCVNDKKEIDYAFEVINRIAAGDSRYFFKLNVGQSAREVWRKIGTHIACLSSTAEISSQWDKYAAAGTGCAVGFDRVELEKWCDGMRISLVPMLYEPLLQDRMMKDFLEAEREVRECRNPGPEGGGREALRSEADKYLFTLAMTLKGENWRDEREWRMLVIRPKGATDFELLTRNDGVRYIELPICGPSIAREVVLGPQCCADIEELKRQLGNEGLSKVSMRYASSRCSPFTS
jgi:hypothetical protein